MYQKSMWIMVSGPFGSGAKNEEERLTNLRRMNRAAVEIFRMGHTPIIGVNMALPMIEAAGRDSYAEIMMPISLGLCDRCDAILRIEGESTGADQEVAVFRERGKVIYKSVSEIPSAVV